ncbi:MAG: YgiQ family radical SAM protein [Methanomicrobiales archaeon]|nr:YgiQ family radical SAM protein [Methanomicrobiales archaeon]
MSTGEGKALGITCFDVILVTGDAFVDHPTFGTAIIARTLWDQGFSVGIIAQPDWTGEADFTRLGEPRLFFGVSSGNVDSMVANYTAAGKRRKEDAYSPGGVPHRPDRAVIVYSNLLRSRYPGVPIILGGLEASLRRFAHYDYWENRVRQSVLADAPADLLVYGMGEHQVLAITQARAAGLPVSAIADIPGTVVKVDLKTWRETDHDGVVILPSFSEVEKNPRRYAEAFALHYREQDPWCGKRVAQPHPKTVVIQNPPSLPLTTAELDHIYELPYSRKAHPSYRVPVPALEPVRWSITSHRGCFGACSFCALTHHQGRIIQSRSEPSILREARSIAASAHFSGTIQDVGGPTANMYGAACDRWTQSGACADRTCSKACPSLHLAHDRIVALLDHLHDVPNVRHVFVSSGIRHDLIPDDSDYLDALCARHVSGHLKVAPEHCSSHVLRLMNKPGIPLFDTFRKRFSAACGKAGKEQYLLPYLMSGHPGCSVMDMIALAEYLRDNRLYTEQVQDFTPTPMSRSTCMYHTGLDPLTMEPVHVPKGREKRIQRALLRYRDPGNTGLVREGLAGAGRFDLIGDGWKCLVRKHR